MITGARKAPRLRAKREQMPTIKALWLSGHLNDVEVEECYDSKNDYQIVDVANMPVDELVAKLKNGEYLLGGAYGVNAAKEVFIEFTIPEEEEDEQE
jgi:hypothetical protein